MIDLYPEMRLGMCRSAHQVITTMLLTQTGLQALEKNLISVAAAHEFYNDTREHDGQMAPGNSFRHLFGNEVVIEALEKGWITLKSAARLSENSSLMCLLTSKGLELLKLIHEEKNKTHPCITLDEIVNFRWGYQLETLLENPNFIPFIQQKKIRFSELVEIIDKELKNTLLSLEGLKALEKNYLSINDVKELPGEQWLSLLLSPNGMKAFEDGFINIQSVLNLIRNAKLIGNTHDLYRNFKFLLNEGFHLLTERYTTFETAVEIYEAEIWFTPPVLSAIKEKLITAEEIRHLSGGPWGLARALLSKEGLEKIRIDNTLVKSLIENQILISGKSISSLDAVAQRIDHYIEELRTIRAGMVDEYSTAQDIVSYLISNFNEISTVLSNFRVDHPYLITKMLMAHKIEASISRTKDRINDPFVQNAIDCDRFPSAQALNTVLQAIEQDEDLKNHLTQLTEIEKSLEQLQTQQFNSMKQEESKGQLKP